MEKVLTISIAAYNVENYIKNTLESLIIENMPDLEILIIVDGSNDKTLEIAQEYEEKYPNTFKAIYKENGGYGSTINKSIELASGKYFKQLDGDDWYETENLNELCEILKKCNEDIIYTPYIKYYEKEKVSEIKNIFLGEKRKTYSIEEAIEKFNGTIEMHSLIYKTELLRKNNIKIEEHCFYTDTELAIYPLLYAKNLVALEKPIYVYRIGCEGQSMSIEGKKKHYKDHIKVGYNILNLYKTINFYNRNNLKNYIRDFLIRFLTSEIVNYFLLFKPNKDIFAEIKEYESTIYTADKQIYDEMYTYSKAIRIIRNNRYCGYVILYYIKAIQRRLKKI